MSAPVPAAPTGDTTQGERTRLAWRRTTLAPLALVGIAVTRLIVTAGRSGLVAVLLMLVVWLTLYLLARRRMRALRAGSRDHLYRTPSGVALLAAAYAVLGLLLLW